MGDVKLDNTSRMGITLQAYHQVIALSQTNINQTLKRHFKIDNTQLANFKAEIGSVVGDPDMSLHGKIDAPTIQLVDSDKADQAIYTLRFLKGEEYMYWYHVTPIEELHQSRSKSRPRDGPSLSLSHSVWRKQDNYHNT
jgi:hypothetical protein